MVDHLHQDEPVQALIRLLADGEFHSGEELGEVLGVSRAAVWKQLQKLQSSGIDVRSTKGRGYVIPGGLNLLDARQIHAMLSPEANSLLSSLEVLAQVDSTNARVLREGQKWGKGYVCLAERQTAGRGRRGRQWVSPFAGNIYLSLSWTYEEGAAVLEGLSLAVGLAIVEALESLGFSGIALKWPNDLLWQGRKLSGVLLEMGGDPAGQCQVVVGVGLNVTMPASAASAIDQPWVDLQSLSPDAFGAGGVTRNTLAATLLNHLLPLLRDYARLKFSHYQAAWEARHAYAGQEVELVMANSRVRGHLLGVDSQGALRLLTDDGERVFYGGEISLRPGI